MEPDGAPGLKIFDDGRSLLIMVLLPYRRRRRRVLPKGKELELGDFM